MSVSRFVSGSKDEFHGIKKPQQGVFGRAISKGPAGEGELRVDVEYWLARLSRSCENPAMPQCRRSFLDKLS